MAKQRICQYGNCENTEINVTVNVISASEKPAFCSEEHAGLWLLKRAMRIYPSIRSSLRDKLEKEANLFSVL